MPVLDLMTDSIHVKTTEDAMIRAESSIQVSPKDSIVSDDQETVGPLLHAFYQSVLDEEQTLRGPNRLD